jgi:putative PIN family toxin of toxin-antitoxin system
MVRVVIDTHVLVSAFLNNVKSRNLVQNLLESHKVILSTQMLAELADALSRDKFNVSADQIKKYLSILVRQATIVAINTGSKIVLEDPDDDAVLNTALCGKASYVVSGDKHLLKIAKHNNIQVLSVNEFTSVIAKKPKKG